METDTIGGLKDLIKARCAPEMDNIASRHLKLWKWNQPGGADRVELDSSSLLDPMDQITSIFGGDEMHPHYYQGSRT